MTPTARAARRIARRRRLRVALLRISDPTPATRVINAAVRETR